MMNLHDSHTLSLLSLFSFQVKFICSRIKKRRKPRVKIVTLKLWLILEKPIFFLFPFSRRQSPICRVVSGTTLCNLGSPLVCENPSKYSSKDGGAILMNEVQNRRIGYCFTAEGTDASSAPCILIARFFRRFISRPVYLLWAALVLSGRCTPHQAAHGELGDLGARYAPVCLLALQP
jgi:hypothetical protein